MQSILVVSENREKAKEYIDKLCKSEKIHPIDININYFETIIGIEEVRNIRKKIFLRPLKSKTKIVVIEAYEGITIESQNALLKILEEPPNNTIIIITAAKIGLILPTILSRCKIIELKDKTSELSKEVITQYLNILISLLSSGVGDRLKLAQDIAKNKDEVIPWLERMILTARQTMLAKYKNEPVTKDQRPETNDYANILISLNKTYNVLKTTNVSPRLALENLFLSWYNSPTSKTW